MKDEKGADSLVRETSKHYCIWIVERVENETGIARCRSDEFGAEFAGSWNLETASQKAIDFNQAADNGDSPFLAVVVDVNKQPQVGDTVTLVKELPVSEWN